MKPIIGGKTTKDNSQRRYPGMGGRRHNPVNIKARRAEALERHVVWSALSLHEKLAVLDRRLGKGAGAVKQRARLAVEHRRSPGQPAGHETTLHQLNAVAQSGKTKAKERREMERNRSGK